MNEGEWDESDARKQFFATIRTAGIVDRSAWAERQGLAISTKEWGEAEYARAMEILVGPVRDYVTENVGRVSLTLDELAQLLELEKVEYLRHWMMCRDAILARLAEQP